MPQLQPRHRSSSELLLPKEIVGPVCQRFAIMLLVMCGTAFSIHMYSLWKVGKLGPLKQYPGLQANGTHFFLDIGSGNSGLQGFSRSRMLEESGWKGVCVDPFPEAGRSSKVLSLPVTSQSGKKLQMPDCRGKNAADGSASASCPIVDLAGVGIDHVLKLSNAPGVIDYINLDTEGGELDILQRFPFHSFCARSWTVTHHYDARQPHIRKLLESRGCRVAEAGHSYWARCPCSKSSQSLLAVSATRAAGSLAAGHRFVPNGKASRLVSPPPADPLTRRVTIDERSALLEDNHRGSSSDDNPCSYLGCNSHTCAWASGGVITKLAAKKSCSNAVPLGSADGIKSKTESTLSDATKILTLKDCLALVRGETSGCSGHFQMHKGSFACSCVPKESTCMEQDEQDVCRYQVIEQ